jgi:hypothetical protein
MRKEPQRRYESAAQFSEDIRRYLEGLPVVARKDIWSYRSAKFVRRHRIAVGAAALVSRSGPNFQEKSVTLSELLEARSPRRSPIRGSSRKPCKPHRKQLSRVAKQDRPIHQASAFH